jgi:hypothetical protein
VHKHCVRERKQIRKLTTPLARLAQPVKINSPHFIHPSDPFPHPSRIPAHCTTSTSTARGLDTAFITLRRPRSKDGEFLLPARAYVGRLDSTQDHECRQDYRAYTAHWTGWGIDRGLYSLGGRLFLLYVLTCCSDSKLAHSEQIRPHELFSTTHDIASRSKADHAYAIQSVGLCQHGGKVAGN